MDREIWFEKVLWSYMPCHWKGVAFIFAIAALALCVIFALNWLLDAFGRSDPEPFSSLAIFPIIVGSRVIAERHSAPKS